VDYWLDSIAFLTRLVHPSLPSGLNRSIFTPLSLTLFNPCSATNAVGRYPNGIEVRDMETVFIVGSGASQKLNCQPALISWIRL
jgi:hypothetical protein